MIARNSDYLWARVGRRCVCERRAVATHTHTNTHTCGHREEEREGGRRKKSVWKAVQRSSRGHQTSGMGTQRGERERKGET